MHIGQRAKLFRSNNCRIVPWSDPKGVLTRDFVQSAVCSLFCQHAKELPRCPHSTQSACTIVSLLDLLTRRHYHTFVSSKSSSFVTDEDPHGRNVLRLFVPCYVNAQQCTRSVQCHSMSHYHIFKSGKGQAHLTQIISAKSWGRPIHKKCTL